MDSIFRYKTPSYFQASAFNNMKKRVQWFLLRSNISLGAQDSSWNMSTSFVRSNLGQTKIRNFGMEIFVQEDVAALKISVNHRGSTMLMEKFQTFSSFKSYSKSGFPVQFGGNWVGTCIFNTISSHICSYYNKAKPIRRNLITVSQAYLFMDYGF